MFNRKFYKCISVFLCAPLCACTLAGTPYMTSSAAEPAVESAGENLPEASSTEISPYEFSTSEDYSTDDSPSEGDSSEASSSENPTSEDSSPENPTSEDSSSEDSLSEDFSTENSTSEDSSSEDSLSEDFSTENSTSEEGYGETGLSVEGTPESVLEDFPRNDDFGEAAAAFDKIMGEKQLMALLYRTESYSVCRSAGSYDDSVAIVETGHTLYIEGIELLDGQVWYRVRFWVDGTEYTGYVEGYFLAHSDEDWVAWEHEYLTNINADGTPYGPAAYSDGESDIAAFPEPYRGKLRALKAQHPGWIFVPMNTGLDFKAAVSGEMGAKSLIQKNKNTTANDWVGDPCPTEAGWYYAKRPAVEYFMNPVNFLTEAYIFQFEQLTFNSSYHNVDAIQSFLANTFMKGKLPDDAGGRTYAQAFFEIGKERKLSPIHLASRVYQEQGQGTSGLISGTYRGYEGYYNFFNVGVNGATTEEKIIKGLKYAKEQGWDTRYKSLEGGAATIGNYYILKMQDTVYLQKFNVDKNSPHGLYNHQYMQNIQAPSSEASSTKNMYSRAGRLDSGFVFKIPVFKNMPDFAEPEKGIYILPVGDQTYTGAAIQPEVKVYDSALQEKGDTQPTELVKDRDYTVTYTNNRNVNTPDTPDSKLPCIIVKGRGNYSGTETVYFNILPKPLDNNDITASDLFLAYNGKVQKPNPRIYHGSRRLANKTDYTLTYPYTDAGAYTDAGVYPVAVNGVKNYKGTITIYETISKKTLMSKASVAKIPDIPYTKALSSVQGGIGITPGNITVTYNGRILKESTDGGETGDYTAAYINNTSVGTATAIITATPNSEFSGSKSVTYKIVGTSISKASVEGIKPKTYTGAEADVYQSDVTLKLDGAALIESKDGGATGDYVVSYAGTGRAGTATVTFKGVNGYTGQLKKTYIIAGFDISGGATGSITMKYSTENMPSDPIPIDSLSEIVSPYMKGGAKPRVMLYNNGTELIPGKDYTVSYTNNTTVTTSGTPDNRLPKITVRGKGGYSGTLTGTWKITDGAMADGNGKLSISAKDITYKNKPDSYRTTLAVTDANGKMLEAGRDYGKNAIYTYVSDTTVYDNDGNPISRRAGDNVDKGDIINANTAIRVTITGIGAYAGSESKKATMSTVYRVIKTDIAKVKLDVAGKSYMNGAAVTLDPDDDIALTMGNTRLVHGTDYVIDEKTYANNTQKGKATVILRGIGENFGGTRKITFTIRPRTFFWR